MSVTSIVVTENPVLTTVPSFLDNLVLNTDNAWVRNSYGHNTKTMGGFDTATFGITGNMEKVQDYLLHGLGRDMKSFNHNGVPVWEGIIFGMKMNVGSSTFQVSFKDMANRVWVRYSSGSQGLLTRSTKQNDLASQARWGIKELVIQGGNLFGPDQADALAQAILEKHRDPTRVAARMAASADRRTRLDITCHGYFRTLEWRRFTQTSSHDTIDADELIQDIVDDSGQFIASTNLTGNTTQVTQEYDNDITAAQAILSTAQRGNDIDQKRYIVGVYENRILRYEKQREPR